MNINNKLILAIETTAVVLLAVVVVIYGQVLWQRMHMQQQTDPSTAAGDSYKLTPATEAQQHKMLEKVSAGVDASTSPTRSEQAAQLNGMRPTASTSDNSPSTREQQLNMLQKF